MPVIRDICLNLSRQDVLRREGLGEPARLRPELEGLIADLLTAAHDGCLLEPAIAFEVYPIAEVRPDGLGLEGGAVLRSPLLAATLRQARELAAAVCTIGPKLEEEVTNTLGRKEPLRGLLLDGIGSAAVDALRREACYRLAEEATRRGLQASSPLSPGMAGLPLSEQRTLFRLLPAAEIGVRLTPSGMMVPEKSASMFVGFGTHMPAWTQAEACARCRLKQTCSHRETAAAASGRGPEPAANE